MANHTIHCNHRHYHWDNSLSPVLTVAPGETVSLEIKDAADGQITPESTARVVATLDPGRVNPVTGPVYIDGAMPGDMLAITLAEYRPSGWGWTANIPGFGLLADQFTEPALHLWNYDPAGAQPMLFGDFARIQLAPFAGTAGVAPAAPGPHSIIPPRRVGGNMDIRDFTEGSTLYLPVEVEGALFSIGDTHAAQGDGEVCGTAVESPIDVTLSFEILKGQQSKFPRIARPPQSPQASPALTDITMGIGPDLHQASRDAVAGMIDLLAAREGMSPVEAYMLCSVAGDLRISQIVDAPNWTVSFHLSRAIFS